MSSFVPPTNPIELLTRLRALRPQREQREPVMIPPVEQLSQEYDSQFEDGPALSSYRQHIQSMPEYEDYKPSFGRKLVAGLVGAGLGAKSPAAGINFANDITQRPYHEAVQQWESRIRPMQEAAGLEELGQRTKRKYINDARDTALKQQHQQTIEDQQFNEFDRKILELERNILADRDRTEDRDYDRAQRAEDARLRGEDRDEDRKSRELHQRTMEDIARGNLDARRNPPPRPTAPLRLTPKHQTDAYKQAMQELIDNPAMADFVQRKNGKFTGFRESSGGLFSAKKKPILSMNGKTVSPADWVKARTEQILNRMKGEGQGQFEDLGYEP